MILSKVTCRTNDDKHKQFIIQKLILIALATPDFKIKLEKYKMYLPLFTVMV